MNYTDIRDFKRWKMAKLLLKCHYTSYGEPVATVGEIELPYRALSIERAPNASNHQLRFVTASGPVLCTLSMEDSVEALDEVLALKADQELGILNVEVNAILYPDKKGQQVLERIVGAQGEFHYLEMRIVSAVPFNDRGAPRLEEFPLKRV